MAPFRQGAVLQHLRLELLPAQLPQRQGAVRLLAGLEVQRLEASGGSEI